MEVESSQSEVIKPSILESDPKEKYLNEDEQFNFDKTIEVENSSLKTSPNESSEGSLAQEINSENGKKKVKEEKPPSKIVVRRLPPTMTKDQFLEQVSPLPEIDYMYYVQGNVNDSINPFSRAYLNFVHQDDLFSFSNTFDNYVFLDAKGQEHPAVVEFNMVQRFPKLRTKKKDPLMGTIEADPSWVTFKENLLAEALENSKTQSGKATKQHYFETEISTTEEVSTTPLLEYLKVRRAEKARIREERREEKKRKESERKLKQKTKEKKDGEEDDSPKDLKIHHKQSEKYEKEVTVDKPTKVIGHEKFDRNREIKSETLKRTVNPQKKILILKSDGDCFDKCSEKCDISFCDEHVISNSKMSELDFKYEKLTSVEVEKSVDQVKEAEQQTIYLRKLLGLLPSDRINDSSDKEVSVKANDQLKDHLTSNISSSVSKNIKIPQQLSNSEPPEEVISAFKDYINVNEKRDILWSKHNINPALPSASFKTSGSTPESGVSLGETVYEQRSLSAPRDSSESSSNSEKKLGKQAAFSTPNVSFVQNSDFQRVVHVSRPLRNDGAQVSNPASEEVLTSKDRRDLKDRDRGVKKKEEKDKIKEPRVREFKSSRGKSYQVERLKLAERREEKRREMLNTDEKKPENIEANDVFELTSIDNSKVSDDKPVKIEKKKYDRKNRYDNDEWKEEKKRIRSEKNHAKRDGRERKDEYSRRNLDKRNSDIDLRRKGKSYKNSDLKLEKQKNRDQDETKTHNDATDKFQEEGEVTKRRSRSVDDFSRSTRTSEGNDSQGSKPTDVPSKRSSSLENQRSEKNSSIDNRVENALIEKKEKSHSRDSKQTENSSSYRSRKDRSKVVDSKSSSMKGKEQSDDQTDKEEKSGKSKSSKSRDAGDSETKESNKPVPRPDRRIRNKDRPSIEIYRPGMGKFSKQRLEKEKALGSSTEVESPSHSPSPTPKSKLLS